MPLILCRLAIANCAGRSLKAAQNTSSLLPARLRVIGQSVKEAALKQR